MTTDTQTMTVVVPPVFWQDHINRGCTPAIEETTVGKKIQLTLDREGWGDLLSDSRHYCDLFFEDGLLHLAMSASWTLSALAKADIPWEPRDYQVRYLRALPSFARPKNWATWTERGDY